MTEPRDRLGGRRRTAARVVAALSGVALMLVPGLGAVDLSSAVLGLSQPQDPLSAMRVGYGLLVGFMLPVAFFAVARDPDRSAAPLQQVYAAALAFGVAAVSGALWVALVGCTVLLVLGGVVHALVGDNRRLLRFEGERLLWGLVAVAGLGAAPWLIYAGRMAAEQRRDARPYEDFTLGVQGWSALSVFAVSVVLFAFIASWRAPGWRSTMWTTGVAAVVFGIVGIVAQRLPGSPGLLGGIASMTWGVAVLAIGVTRGKRPLGVRESPGRRPS